MAFECRTRFRRVATTVEHCRDGDVGDRDRVADEPRLPGEQRIDDRQVPIEPFAANALRGGRAPDRDRHDKTQHPVRDATPLGG